MPLVVDHQSVPVGAASGKKLNGCLDSSNVHDTETVAPLTADAGAVMVALYGAMGMLTMVLGGPSVTGTAVVVLPMSNATPTGATAERAGSTDVLERTR